MHSCWAFGDPCNFCGSSWPVNHSYPLTLFLCFSSQNCSFSRTAIGCHVSCSGVLMMSCLLSSSSISPHRDHLNLEINSNAVIEQVWRYTWRPWSCQLGGQNRASLEIHLEAVIERIWKCTWRLWTSELGDALHGCNRASLEMHLEGHDHANLEDIIMGVWRYSWRVWSSEIGDTLGGIDWVNLGMHSQIVIEQVWRSTWRPWSSEIEAVLGGDQSGGGSSGGRHHGSWDSIHWLTRYCGNVENWVQHGLPRDERLAGSGIQSVLGWCSTWCIQYSVYAVLGVCCTWCILYLVYAGISVCCTWW